MCLSLCLCVTQSLPNERADNLTTSDPYILWTSHPRHMRLFSRSLCRLRWYSIAFILERWLCRPENPSSTIKADKSFCVAGPRAWNSLPSHIRTLVSRDSFSRHLKTHFFKLSYDIQWFVPIHVAVLTVYVLVSIFNLSLFSIVGTSEQVNWRLIKFPRWWWWWFKN